MSRLNAVTKHQLHTSGGLQRVGPLLAETHPEFVISKRRMRKVESINWVRLNREGCPTEPRLLIAAICPPRTSNKTSVVRLPLPRTPKRPVCSSGHRSSKLRLALGTRPAGAHISGDTGDPTANSTNHVRKRRSDAGHVRHAARRHPVSPFSRGLSADLRGDHVQVDRRFQQSSKLSWSEWLGRTAVGATTASSVHWPALATSCRTGPSAAFCAETTSHRHRSGWRPRIGRSSSDRM